MSGECPVVHIHKVTDNGDAEGPEAKAVGKCPVDHTAMKKPGDSQPSSEVEVLDIDVDQIGDTPSVKEYKKLKKVMAMITKFYHDGSEKKRANYETMVEQLGNLDVDKTMCEDQLKALDSNPSFKVHPKSKQYRKNLNDELEGLNKQKVNLEKHRDEYQGLYVWSKKIVEICEWLENHFDHYAKEKIPDLNPQLLKNLKPMKDLTPEEMADYSKGLAEITYNLAESQDFFAASVDGRLKKYHAIEKAIIQAQIEAIKGYPEDSPRRMYVMDELEKDKGYVEGLMVEDPSSINRKSKMLKNHQEFLKVLVYHREKLGVLGDVPELQYNPKYDHYTE